MSKMTFEKPNLEAQLKRLTLLAEAEHRFPLGAPDEENPFAGNAAKVEYLKARLQEIEEREEREKAEAFVADFNRFAKVKGDLADCQKHYGQIEHELVALQRQAEPILKRLQLQYRPEPLNDRICASMELGCPIVPSDPIYRLGGPLAPPFGSPGWKVRLTERATQEERVLLKSFSQKKQELAQIGGKMSTQQSQVSELIVRHPEFADAISSSYAQMKQDLRQTAEAVE